MQFADPKNDIAFKKIFGNENKTNILISFLNAVLDFKDKEEIVEVTIVNPYQVPHIKELKNTILDIKAKDKQNNEFIIEMQVETDKAFAKRSLYYTSKSYVTQIAKAEDYKKLNKVYFIGILDFSIFESDDYISRHLILDKKTFKNELQDFEFTFIELPKFNIALKDCDNNLKRWIHFIQNADTFVMIPKEYENIQEFYDAFSIAKTYNWNKDELEVYDYISMNIGIVKNSLETAREMGIQEGMEKEKINIAKSLLDVLDIETIALKTGLSVAKLEELKQELRIQ